MSYIPAELKHKNVKFDIIKISTTKVLGSDKTIEEKIGEVFANFKTYGGTEREVNGKYVIEDTAIITTDYRPDIQSDCLLVRVADGAKFEILNEPEDIEFRHIALKFKVRRLKGKFNG